MSTIPLKNNCQRTAGLCAALLLSQACLAATVASDPASAAEDPHQLALIGVNIIDTRSGRVAHNMSLLIDHGRITHITRGKLPKLDGAAQSIDARGKFIVPGYLDMHSHALNAGDPDQLALMLANGITGYRQMSGSPMLLDSRRQGKVLSSAATPELLAMPGTVLAGPNVATPDLVIAEVRRQKDMGADFIKFIDLPPAAFFAGLNEATRWGFPPPAICPRMSMYGKPWPAIYIPLSI